MYFLFSVLYMLIENKLQSRAELYFVIYFYLLKEFQLAQKIFSPGKILYSPGKT